MGSEFFDGLKDIAWKETMFKDLQAYDYGDGIFMLRCKHNEPNEHYLFIKAADVDEAISRAVFDLHKPFEQMGNVGRMREACQKMRDLIMLRGDGKAQCVLTWDEFNESQKMIRAALAEPARNCDRFADETEAMVAFLNEVWLVSVEDLKDDPFDEWTPEMKARYAKWLMEKKECAGDEKA